MKKICLLFVLFLIMNSCVYDGLRMLYGDEWIDDHLAKNETDKDRSADTDNSGQTPVYIFDDQTNDTIVQSTTST